MATRRRPLTVESLTPNGGRAGRLRDRWDPRRAPRGYPAARLWIMGATMTKDETLKLLREHKPVLVERFGVTSLALFGSTVRNQAEDGSDIDILVGFDGPADWRRYFGAQFYIEDLLGRPVDLVTDKALRRELRPYVEAEAVCV